MGRKSKYPAEVRERAIRLVFEQLPAHASEWAPTLVKPSIGPGERPLRRRSP
jgi:hypothetical protein